MRNKPVTNKILIRKAALSDMETLLRFEQGVIKVERPFDNTLQADPITYYNIEEMITSPQIELLVAQCEGKIIGSGYVRIENSKHYLQHSQHAYLGFMYVEPEFRGKGVNKKIIEALQVWSKSKNITEMRLDVYYNNSNAIQAYEKAGFIKHMIEMRMATVSDKDIDHNK
jgi:ribosomal protein S18 acetylase RimI-like enzyme